MKTLLRIIVYLAVIFAVVALGLFLAIKIAGVSTVWELFSFIVAAQK